MKESILISSNIVVRTKMNNTFSCLSSNASEESTPRVVTTLAVENQLVWFMDFIEQNQVLEDIKAHLLQKWHLKSCLTKREKSYVLISCYSGGWHLPMLETSLIQSWQVPSFSCLPDEFTLLYDQTMGRAISSQ
jgi:hypothetical protein